MNQITTPEEAALNRLQEMSALPVTQETVEFEHRGDTVVARLNIQNSSLNEKERQEWGRMLREQGYTETADRLSESND